MANVPNQRVVLLQPDSNSNYREAQVNESGQFVVSPVSEAANIDQLGTGQVTVDTTGDLIVAARSGRSSVLIVNHGSTAVYLGNQAVNSSDGLLLPGVAGASVSIPGGSAIYGKTDSGSQVVSYMEVF